MRAVQPLPVRIASMPCLDSTVVVPRLRGPEQRHSVRGCAFASGYPANPCIHRLERRRHPIASEGLTILTAATSDVSRRIVEQLMETNDRQNKSSIKTQMLFFIVTTSRDCRCSGMFYSDKTNWAKSFNSLSVRFDVTPCLSFGLNLVITSSIVVARPSLR